MSNSGSNNFFDASLYLGVYSIDPSTGALTQVSGSPYEVVAGPSNSYSLGSVRSVAVDPTGGFLLILNNQVISGANSSWSLDSTLSVFEFNKLTGQLTEVSGSPFDVGGFANSFAIDPNGKFVYAVNYALTWINNTQLGEDSVRTFGFDSNTGVLTPITGSTVTLTGQDIAIDATGNFAYLLDSQGLTTYAIDPATGALSASGSTVSFSGGYSVSIDPSGMYCYVTAPSSQSGQPGQLFAFAINSTTGKLTAISGSPFATGVTPMAIAVAGDLE